MSSSYHKDACSNKRASDRSKTIKLRHGVGAVSALCALFGVSAIATAQDNQPPGLVASLDVTQRLEYSDNPDLEAESDSDIFGRTILGFGLAGNTDIQSFEFNLGLDIEQGRNDRSSIDLLNPFVNFGYDRASRASRIGVDLSYRESDVDSQVFDEEFLEDGDSINQSTGTRSSYRASLSGAIGEQAPIGASYQLSRSEIQYSGTVDPDLTDRTTDNASGQLEFRIDPRITARLTANYSNLDVDGDGVDRRTTGFGAGVGLDVTPRLTIDTSLSQTRVEQSGTRNEVDEGLSFGVDVSQAMVNGSLNLNLASDVTSNGRRESLRLSRSMTLQRGSELSFNLGATRSDESDLNPLYGLSYQHVLPSAEISVSLSQTVTADSNNQEEINTTLRGSYRQDINELSSLSATISLFNRNELGAAADDGQRVELGLSYRYALTRDWGLVTGVSHTLSSRDSEADRSSNAIFVGIQRSFAWFP
ncbi:hypothetical protein [uncultured Roseobacter sp.]|uniref:hypothetical protein n=1 Tax=uncultured Roseobacter sp. TaxID=114847 RepID=UPI00263A1836|nr:hypothetical protein [uncultured Roseobacter sp.]